jgi:hypothetical protein
MGHLAIAFGARREIFFVPFPFFGEPSGTHDDPGCDQARGQGENYITDIWIQWLYLSQSHEIAAPLGCLIFDVECLLTSASKIE